MATEEDEDANGVRGEGLGDVVEGGKVQRSRRFHHKGIFMGSFSDVGVVRGGLEPQPLEAL